MKKIWESFSHHKQPCHVGPVEVIQNLFCGSMDESIEMVTSARVNTLVPLESLSAKIWDLGFRGEILYYPIHDFEVLPTDVLEELVAKILLCLDKGKKVGIFCQGGHGRTGYVASVILGKLGVEDPIRFLRKHYCKKAVESNIQIEHIAKVLDKPELAERYASPNVVSGLFNISPYPWWGYDVEAASFLCADSPVCGDCSRCKDGLCEIYHTPMDADEIACENFLPNKWLL